MFKIELEIDIFANHYIFIKLTLEKKNGLRALASPLTLERGSVLQPLRFCNRYIYIYGKFVI